MITNNNRRIIIEFYRVYIFTELQKILIYFFCLAHKKKLYDMNMDLLLTHRRRRRRTFEISFFYAK